MLLPRGYKTTDYSISEAYAIKSILRREIAVIEGQLASHGVVNRENHAPDFLRWHDKAAEALKVKRGQLEKFEGRIECSGADEPLVLLSDCWEMMLDLKQQNELRDVDEDLLDDLNRFFAGTHVQ